MNRIERSDMNKAISVSAIDPILAARILAPAIRAAGTSKTWTELMNAAITHGIAKHFTMVNGQPVAN